MRYGISISRYQVFHRYQVPVSKYREHFYINNQHKRCLCLWTEWCVGVPHFEFWKWNMNGVRHPPHTEEARRIVGLRDARPFDCPWCSHTRSRFQMNTLLSVVGCNSRSSRRRAQNPTQDIISYHVTRTPGYPVADCSPFMYVGTTAVVRTDISCIMQPADVSVHHQRKRRSTLLLCP